MHPHFMITLMPQGSLLEWTLWLCRADDAVASWASSLSDCEAQDWQRNACDVHLDEVTDIR